MKRTAFKLLLFLLAGAIINVAVAWGCALLPPSNDLGSLRMGFSHSDEPRWFVSYQRTLPKTWTSMTFQSVPDPRIPVSDDLPYWSLARVRPAVRKAEPTGHHIWEEAFGLPCRSMRQLVYAHRDFTAVTTFVFDSVKYGIRIEKPNPTGDAWRDFRALPCQLLWPGFAINTIFYAAIVWVLFAVPGAIRKRVRRKRGQCAACGYSLRGTPEIDKCPECGATA